MKCAQYVSLELKKKRFFIFRIFANVFNSSRICAQEDFSKIKLFLEIQLFDYDNALRYLPLRNFFSIFSKISFSIRYPRFLIFYWTDYSSPKSDFLIFFKNSRISQSCEKNIFAGGRYLVTKHFFRQCQLSQINNIYNFFLQIIFRENS